MKKIPVKTLPNKETVWGGSNVWSQHHPERIPTPTLPTQKLAAGNLASAEGEAKCLKVMVSKNETLRIFLGIKERSSFFDFDATDGIKDIMSFEKEKNWKKNSKLKTKKNRCLQNQ